MNIKDDSIRSIGVFSVSIDSLSTALFLQFNGIIIFVVGDIISCVINIFCDFPAGMSTIFIV